MPQNASPQHLPRLQLSGFNNLTKSLSFNLFDVCYAETPDEQQEYIAYIDKVYDAARLTRILQETCERIQATILACTCQDYEPQGASATMLICEEPLTPDAQGPEIVLGHLDKSHICVHTYPEIHPQAGICTFRTDIEVSTCGELSPLRALDHLITSFEADVIVIDYRVRGFTRDADGIKYWMDHELQSIRDFISPDILANYDAYDANMPQDRFFQSKLMRVDEDLNTYVFGEEDAYERFDHTTARRIRRRLRAEIEDIFYARNIIRAKQ
ncbi:MAG: adenosylmethionine decarboxylase [Planctomycetota bacterium]